MNALLLILSFFLSFSSGGMVADIEPYERLSAVAETAGQNNPDTDPNSYAQAILPVQSARFSGEDSTIASAVRSTGSGRRTQVSQKSLFRIIKGGKIIDKHNFYFFQAELHQFQSGIHSTSRYIHSICHLLI